MGSRPVRSILPLERAEYLGRRAGVRYSRSLVASRTGSRPAASKSRRGGREQRGGSRGSNMVFRQRDRVGRGGQAEHELKEVAAGGDQSPGSEDAGSADDQGAVEIGLGVKFAGEFGNGVGAEGMGRVFLDVR